MLVRYALLNMLIKVLSIMLVLCITVILFSIAYAARTEGIVSSSSRVEETQTYICFIIALRNMANEAKSALSKQEEVDSEKVRFPLLSAPSRIYWQ